MPSRHVPAILALLLSIVLVVACTVSPTGRKQLLLFPEGEVATLGATAFTQQKQATPASRDTAKKQYVQCISNQLLVAMGENPSEWEVVLFEDKQINAFALPGRKIGVYTGLLDVAGTPDMLAAVIGHEIGHVIARHSNERLSTQYAAQTGLAVIQALGGEMTEQKKMIYGALGLGAQYGIILPYGRKQELEADRIGLELMARSGFNPKEAVTLWENMSRAGSGQPPQFLSTHPSNQTRINDLQTAMPGAVALQAQARASGIVPRCR